MAKIKYVDHRYNHQMAYAMFSAILGKEVTEENMTYNDVRKAVGCIRIGDTPFNQRWDVSPYALEDTVHLDLWSSQRTPQPRVRSLPLRHTRIRTRA